MNDNVEIANIYNRTIFLFVINLFSYAKNKIVKKKNSFVQLNLLDSCNLSKISSTNFLFFLLNEYILILSDIRCSQSDLSEIFIQFCCDNSTKSISFHKLKYYDISAVKIFTAFLLNRWIITSFSKTIFATDLTDFTLNDKFEIFDVSFAKISDWKSL